MAKDNACRRLLLHRETAARCCQWPQFAWLAATIVARFIPYQPRKIVLGPTWKTLYKCFVGFFPSNVFHSSRKHSRLLDLWESKKAICVQCPPILPFLDSTVLLLKTACDAASRKPVPGYDLLRMRCLRPRLQKKSGSEKRSLYL